MEFVKIKNYSTGEITESPRAEFIAWAKVNNGFKYYKIISTFTKTPYQKPPEAVEAEILAKAEIKNSEINIDSTTSKILKKNKK